MGVQQSIDARYAALAATLAGADTLRSIRPRPHASTQPSAATTQVHGLAFGAKLGEGGMAVVRAATQLALGREVAVKTSREGDDPATEQALVSEAWITGRLEHPNIVPVHDLRTDEHGRPQIVMKRIEGSAWSSMIGSRELAWNLALFVQVCQAVAFAHSRGVIHRDLKPSNVMIGEFGEVYVLDWGIAVSTIDDGSGRIPLASEVRDVAGTLAYMAPEMLDGDRPLTTAADVYLLGAILYEIITGKPPHLAPSVTDAFHSIARSEPHLPADVRDELAAICRRAMAREPNDRYAGADELRRAVLAFVEHRGSAEVTHTALAHLAALTDQLRDPDPATRVAAYQLFGQCRFGFQEALRTWSGNRAARDGLDRALAAMAGYELDHGDPRAAAVLIAELSAPNAELAARVAELERVRAAEARELAALKREHDASYGAGTRILFVLGVAFAFVVLPLAGRFLPTITVDHPTSLVTTGCVLAAIGVLAYRARTTLMRTAINRGIVVTLFVSLAAHGAIEALAWALGLDMIVTHWLAIATWFGTCATAAVFIDRALLVPALGYAVALAVSVRDPDQRLWAISWSSGVLAATGAYIWWTARRGRRMGGLVTLFRAPEA